MKTCYFTGLRPHEFPFDHADESTHAHILYTDALYQKAEELIRRGFICNLSHEVVLRLLPALNIPEEDLRAFADTLEDILANIKR